MLNLGWTSNFNSQINGHKFFTNAKQLKLIMKNILISYVDECKHVGETMQIKSE